MRLAPEPEWGFVLFPLQSGTSAPCVKESDLGKEWVLVGKANDSSAGDGERNTMKTRQTTIEPLPPAPCSLLCGH